MYLFSASFSVEDILIHTGEWFDVSVLKTAVLKLTLVFDVGLFMIDIISFSYSKSGVPYHVYHGPEYWD